jgi:hypothetical protein
VLPAIGGPLVVTRFQLRSQRKRNQRWLAKWVLWIARGQSADGGYCEIGLKFHREFLQETPSVTLRREQNTADRRIGNEAVSYTHNAYRCCWIAAPSLTFCVPRDLIRLKRKSQTST